MWSLHHYPFSTKQANEWPFIALPIKLYLPHSFGYYLCWPSSNVISSLYIYFFKSQSYTFTCLLETLLVIWQLKSSVQKWILYFFPKHNLFCYPLLSEYNYSPSFTSYSVFFPESSLSPNSGDDQVLSIISVYHLSGLLPFLPFYCFYLSQAFIIFLVYLSKYASSLSDWF